MFSAKQISSGQGILALLNCRRLPARLSTGEPLIAAKLLAPLGKPAPNAPKYFATVDVLAVAQDRDWLVSGYSSLVEALAYQEQSQAIGSAWLFDFRRRGLRLLASRSCERSSFVRTVWVRSNVSPTADTNSPPRSSIYRVSIRFAVFDSATICRRASGRVLKTCNSLSAAPDGTRSPDSHFRTVTTGTLRI
jgi:hypothetical protein